MLVFCLQLRREGRALPFRLGRRRLQFGLVFLESRCVHANLVGTPIRSVSPLKRGPNDLAIFPSRDWSMSGDTIM